MTLPDAYARLQRNISLITAGGLWTYQLKAPVRRNLRWVWFDGLFAQIVDSVTQAYTSLFVLSLGGSSEQIGLMTALSSLGAALVLLPGGALADRRERRRLIVLAGGTIARTMFLLLALLPIVFLGPAGVAAAIVLVVVRDSFTYMTLPAWTTLVAEIVPQAWRGRYFGSRNFVMALSGIVVTLLAGQLISRMGELRGYQLVLGLAWAAGMASTLSFSRVAADAPAPAQTQTASAASFSLREILSNRLFAAFALTAVAWNFSLNIAGPFFNVYIVEGLHGDAAAVGLLAAVNSLSLMPGQWLFGGLTDRWGPRRVQLLTGLLIPILPFAWIFVQAPWHIIFINLLSGVLWAGYLTASFSMLLSVTPEAQRPRFTAVYHMLVLTSLGAGAAVGGLVVGAWGYRAAFFLSGAGRLLAAILFARFVIPPSPAVRPPADATG